MLDALLHDVWHAARHAPLTRLLAAAIPTFTLGIGANTATLRTEQVSY
jgi:hypothetical protein